MKRKMSDSMLFQKLAATVVLLAVFWAAFYLILFAAGDYERKRVAMQRAGNHMEEVERLHALKVLNPTDTEAVEKLMYAIIDETFLYRGWNNDKEPFTVTTEKDLLLIDYNVWILRPDSFIKKTADYSALLLALIPDIRQIQWEYDEIQEGGTSELKTLYYDWNMMKDEEFTDSAIAKLAKNSVAKDFGASASALQLLTDSLSYYERYQSPKEKKAVVTVTEEQMKQEILDLPLEDIRSYENLKKCETIYVEAINSEDKEEYNTEVWESFYEKVQKNEPASVIIGGYNVLENVQPDEDGSVYYCNVHYDGEQFYVLFDFVDSDRNDDFSDGMQTGKYLVHSDSTINDISAEDYFICDDPSVSWRDIMFSGTYAGINDLAPIDLFMGSLIRSVYH